CLETLEDADAMSRAMQEQCRREPRGPAAADGYVGGLHERLVIGARLPAPTWTRLARGRAEYTLPTRSAGFAWTDVGCPVPWGSSNPDRPCRTLPCPGAGRRATNCFTP